MRLIPWRDIADDTFRAHSDDWGNPAAELELRVKPRTFHLEENGDYTTRDGYTIPSVKPIPDPKTYDLTHVDDMPPPLPGKGLG